MTNFENRPLLRKAVEDTIALSEEPHSNSSPSTIGSFQRVPGGCISTAARVTLVDGRQYFVKSSHNDLEIYEAEHNGLDAIRATQTLTVPKVIGMGRTQCGYSFLVLEAIKVGCTTANSNAEFGRSLAQMHRKTQTNRFGYSQSNFIGSTVQLNTWGNDWQTFFVENRLRPQIKMAQNQALTTRLFDQYADQLLSRMGDLLNDSSSPVLIHGDLWAGNVIVSTDGQPVLIDPAVSYSERESEFGMTTLFGEFGPEFYEAYNECWPLMDGWQERVKIYQLYHLLNHLNLFGHSYFEPCMNILQQFA
jgi:protein-ribulosamine 3-kinase